LIYQLSPEDFGVAGEILTALDFHLAAIGIVDRTAPGEIYVDDPGRPQSCLAHTGRRFFLSGNEHNPAFNSGVRELFLNSFYPRALAAREEAFSLFYASTGWESAIEGILQGKYPLKTRREYYELKALQPAMGQRLPVGFEIRPVDAALLSQAGLNNLDRLGAEIVSECPSVQAFRDTRFGFYAIKERDIAGWCLSEYNRDGRCEVGIETVEQFQQQGIGTALTRALVEHARLIGISRIGWHCYASNMPSAATAVAAGFKMIKEYSAFLAFTDEAAALAAHGNACFHDRRYAEAASWYTRAIQTERVPAWVEQNLEKAKKHF